MALKTFLNGTINNLTSTAHPLVTFVGGVKKKLPKGVTFVNGEKVVLWDANELQVSYINPASLGMNPYYPAVAFFANRDYLLYSFQNNIIKLSIRNAGNVSIADSIQLGNVIGYSSVDSSVRESVYYAFNSAGDGVFNQVDVVNSTGEMSVSRANNIPKLSISRECGAYVNGEWLNANSVTNQNRYVVVRDGNTVKYEYVSFDGGSGTTLSGFIDGPLFTKIDNNTLVGRMYVSNGTKAIAEFDSNGYTVKTSGSLIYSDFLTDGNIVACAGNGFGLYERNLNGNYTTIATQAAMSNHYERLMGKCRGNYYTVSCPTSSDSQMKYYLRVYDSDGVLFETRELDGLANVESGNLKIIPQLSRTGYLTMYIPKKYNSGTSIFVVVQCY